MGPGLALAQAPELAVLAEEGACGSTAAAARAASGDTADAASVEDDGAAAAGAAPGATAGCGAAAMYGPGLLSVVGTGWLSVVRGADGGAASEVDAEGAGHAAGPALRSPGRGAPNTTFHREGVAACSG